MIIFSEAYWNTINAFNETFETKTNFLPPPVFVINEDVDAADPTLRLKPIRSEGPNFRMIFNQDMSKPPNIASFNYSRVFEILILTAEDQTQIYGEFVLFDQIKKQRARPTPKSNSRKL